jgi:hypothetical protein
MDRSYQGQYGIVRADLTRWNEPVLAACQSRPNFTGTRGLNAFGNIGELMLTEGLAYPLWVFFPYSPANAGGKVAYTGMPAGYRYLNAWLMGPDTMPVGTLARKVSCVFIAMTGFNPVTGAMPLYDFNMTGLPAIN